MPLGSLREVLDKKTIIPPDVILQIAQDVAKAMKYLHMIGILHRDLKTANLLVDTNWHIKVTDFGMAKLIRKGPNAMQMTGNVGTLAWVAPEVLDPSVTTYTEKVDVYSYGVVLWEIVTSDIPFTNVEAGLRSMVIGGARPDIPIETPKFWKQLIRQCWQQDPEKRPSFRDISRKLSNHSRVSLLNESRDDEEK
eukprot:TRINITY_DN382_c0_g1_i2.p1 TRINITY_DN382_c0_g1~~TRINITY_DN382_c0_g1_i2.p1  ORF type:complete len:194 (+),score=26.11 TRINITY_DN382_c0_g1_i2:117-698(+)